MSGNTLAAQYSLDTANRIGRPRVNSPHELARHHGAKIPPVAAKSIETFSILSLSPIPEDHAALNDMVGRPEASGSVDLRLLIEPVVTLEAALRSLTENPCPAVLCERDLGTFTWKDVLPALATLPDPPLLIVTSRLADERLWAEALNLGAHDVLAKPFAAQEVTRVLRLACLRWKNARRAR